MTPNRDILFMHRHQMMSKQDMAHEVSQLHQLLFRAERMDNFALAHEVLDLQRYKIISNITAIKKMIRTSRFDKPFIFFSNKN